MFRKYGPEGDCNVPAHDHRHVPREFGTVTSYRCLDCRTELEASPLRVTCPECGGRLRGAETSEATPETAEADAATGDPDRGGPPG